MKKNVLLIFLALFMSALSCANGADSAGPGGAKGEPVNITVTVGTKTFSAVLEGNETAAAFLARLPLTLDMSDLNGNEFYNYLSSPLPSKASNPRKINAGDIKLYGSSCIVIFYKSFTTGYSYTNLGKISGSGDLEKALKESGGKVTFSPAAD